MTTIWLPVTLALASSLMYALMVLFVRMGVRTASSATALWLTLAVNVVLLWGWSLVAYGPQFERWWEWRYFALSGLFAPLLGRLLQFQGMAKLGANITTAITLTHPVFTVLLAVLFLNEPIGLIGLLGILLVVAGSVAVGAEKDKVRGTRVLRASWLLLPVLASLCYGIAMVFRKIGLGSGSDPVTAAAVTVTSAWLCSGIYAVLSGQHRSMRCDRKEFKFFVLAGISSGVGPVLAYSALQRADLVVVAPLAATSPLFTLMLTRAFLHAEEIFSFKVLGGTVATVAGVIMVATFGASNG